MQKLSNEPFLRKPRWENKPDGPIKLKSIVNHNNLNNQNFKKLL